MAGHKQKYRVFRRQWWKDKACTIPKPNARKFTVCTVETAEEAREECRSRGLMQYGATMRGPYGAAFEYERIA